MSFCVGGSARSDETWLQGGQQQSNTEIQIILPLRVGCLLDGERERGQTPLLAPKNNNGVGEHLAPTKHGTRPAAEPMATPRLHSLLFGNGREPAAHGHHSLSAAQGRKGHHINTPQTHLPRGCFFFSILSILGVCPFTLPARASDP